MKKEVKKWIKEEIPVKPPRPRRCNRRRVERRAPQATQGEENGARPRREENTRNQPGILNYFTRRPDQNRNNMMMNIHDDMEQQRDDQQSGVAQADDYQLRGRPPDSESLRLP